eukprot:CAMPEP_0170596716 /NCGR_PEP_ID=MMETSP0224-20130122/15287_1 /TAXON_ID=285029 /ORGANISM="Togula jolla, Strain CCCM 725" /LENGTH=774 /DNA_ID=CAMNT_0010921069 /DNA_START=39 /DNA_END=2361 /DNA_ORIENTATION=-
MTLLVEHAPGRQATAFGGRGKWGRGSAWWRPVGHRRRLRTAGSEGPKAKADLPDLQPDEQGPAQSMQAPLPASRRSRSPESGSPGRRRAIRAAAAAALTVAGSPCTSEEATAITPEESSSQLGAPEDLPSGEGRREDQIFGIASPAGGFVQSEGDGPGEQDGVPEWLNNETYEVQAAWCELAPAEWWWSQDVKLEGDETLLGPDGDVYEVFYPRGCLNEAYSESPECQPSSAEIGISDMVAFMKNVATERHPARARLFGTVRAASEAALGQHFERLALVGSTALRIDTPDSDLDAVAFTRSTVDDSGKEIAPPLPSVALRRIKKALESLDDSLNLQLVDCTHVPVLMVSCPDGQLLDLTVDQPLGEWHVMWFQSLCTDAVLDPAPLDHVPRPSQLGWEQSLEAAALRCMKWWLRRRHIPVSKEGGFPTVVWTLMMIHVLRCSLFLNETQEANGVRDCTDGRALLGAIAAFFDRFAENRITGTLFFSGGTQAEFRPWEANSDPQGPEPLIELSVLDPVTTYDGSAEWGIRPTDLAPPISSATRLLHAYELRRAQQLSLLALSSCGQAGEANADGVGADALRELFAETGSECYVVPSVMPPVESAAILLRGEGLLFGILQSIEPKRGWSAPFLHRRDMKSRLRLQLCRVDSCSGALEPEGPSVWAHPGEVVCLAPVSRGTAWDNSPDAALWLTGEGLQRWCGLVSLLEPEVPQHTEEPATKEIHVGRRRARNRRHQKAALHDDTRLAPGAWHEPRGSARELELPIWQSTVLFAKKK